MDDAKLLASKLLVERSNLCESNVRWECLAAIGGYKRGIQPKFSTWQRALKRTMKYHISLKTVEIYQTWWDEKLGHIGRIKLTRRLIASRPRCPREWNLT